MLRRLENLLSDGIIWLAVLCIANGVGMIAAALIDH